MQWFKNLFNKRGKSLLMASTNYISKDTISENHQSLHSDPLRLNIYPANGGTIVETRMYDHAKDRNNNRLYIITDEEDMGNAISKIIMMENLR